MNSTIKFYDQTMEIPIETGKKVHYYGKLMYVRYEAPYCWLHFADNPKCKVEIALQEIMRNLPQYVFFQCNKSTIINLCYHTGYNTYTRTVIMDDGKRFELSRRKANVFKNMKEILPRLSPPCPACYTCTKKDCDNRVVFCR